MPHLLFSNAVFFWANLRLICATNTLPWLCVGDFNEVLYHWEKIGKRFADSTRMQAFRDVLHDCSLMDIESKGYSFTWMNNRAGADFVKERLDRALCNLDWRLTFPEAEVFALPAVGSDHSPLLLITAAVPRRRHRPFIFEAFWIQEPDCRDIIALSWTSTQPHTSALPSKLKAVSLPLAQWSRSKFSKGHNQLAVLYQQLQHHTNQTLHHYDASLVTHLP